MRYDPIRQIAGVTFVGIVATLVVSSCVIRLGSVDGAGGQSAVDDSVGAAVGGGGGGEPSEDEILAEFAGASPADVARVTEGASFAAVSTSSLVQSQFVDPQTADPALVEQFFADYAPVATDDAMAYIASLDPSVFEAFEFDPSCQPPPYNCQAFEKCPWLVPDRLAHCVVTSCGRGTCPLCPPGLFGNLVFNSWCAYACVSGGKVVGGAYVLYTVGNFKLGPVCFPG